MNILPGDRLTWDASQFRGGSFFRGRSKGAKFTGTVRLSGMVERDSYGERTGQHTFTIRLDDGTLKHVKGRNLYPHIVEHIPGPDHAEQEAAKQSRIDLAVQTAGTLSNLPARLRRPRSTTP